jgi:hypothetical protein
VERNAPLSLHGGVSLDLDSQEPHPQHGGGFPQVVFLRRQARLLRMARRPKQADNESQPSCRELMVNG